MSAAFNISSLKCSVMYPEHESSFVKEMTAFHAKGKYLDLIFICKENVYVRANKIILMSVSNLISKIVYTIGDDIVYITLPDVEHKTVEILQNFIYEGVTKVNIKEFISLRELICILNIRLTNVEIKSLTCGNDFSSNENKSLPHNFTHSTFGLINWSSQNISYGYHPNKIKEEYCTSFNTDYSPYNDGSNIMGNSFVKVKYETAPDVGVNNVEKMDVDNFTCSIKTEETVIQPADFHNSVHHGNDPLTFRSSDNLPHMNFLSLYNPYIPPVESSVLYTPHQSISDSHSGITVPKFCATNIKEEITDNSESIPNTSGGVQEVLEIDPLDTGAAYSGDQEFLRLHPAATSVIIDSLYVSDAPTGSTFYSTSEEKVDGRFAVSNYTVPENTSHNDTFKETTLPEVENFPKGKINQLLISDSEGNLNEATKCCDISKSNNLLPIDDGKRSTMPMKSRKRKRVAKNTEVELIAVINHDNSRISKTKTISDFIATNNIVKATRKNVSKANAMAKSKEKTLNSGYCLEGNSTKIQECKKFDEKSNNNVTCVGGNESKQKSAVQQLHFLNDVNKVTRSMLKKLCQDTANKNTVKDWKNKLKQQSKQSENTRCTRGSMKQTAINNNEEAIFRSYLATIEHTGMKKTPKTDKNALESNVSNTEKDLKSPKEDICEEKLDKVESKNRRCKIKKHCETGSYKKENGMRNPQEYKKSVVNRKLSVKESRVKKNYKNQKGSMVKVNKNNVRRKCKTQTSKSVLNIENEVINLAEDIDKQNQPPLTSEGILPKNDIENELINLAEDINIQNQPQVTFEDILPRKDIENEVINSAEDIDKHNQPQVTFEGTLLRNDIENEVINLAKDVNKQNQPQVISEGILLRNDIENEVINLAEAIDKQNQLQVISEGMLLRNDVESEVINSAEDINERIQRHVTSEDIFLRKDIENEVINLAEDIDKHNQPQVTSEGTLLRNDIENEVINLAKDVNKQNQLQVISEGILPRKSIKNEVINLAEDINNQNQPQVISEGILPRKIIENEVINLAEDTMNKQDKSETISEDMLPRKNIENQVNNLAEDQPQKISEVTLPRKNIAPEVIHFAEDKINEQEQAQKVPEDVLLRKPNSESITNVLQFSANTKNSLMAHKNLEYSDLHNRTINSSSPLYSKYYQNFDKHSSGKRRKTVRHKENYSLCKDTRNPESLSEINIQSVVKNMDESFNEVFSQNKLKHSDEFFGKVNTFSAVKIVTESSDEAINQNELKKMHEFLGEIKTHNEMKNMTESFDEVISPNEQKNMNEYFSDVNTRSDLKNMDGKTNSGHLSSLEFYLPQADNSVDNSNMDAVMKCADGFVHDRIHEKPTNKLESALSSEISNSEETDNTDDLVYKCPQCTTRFDSRDGFDRHMVLSHSDKNIQKLHSTIFPARRYYYKRKSKPDSIEKEHVCDLCYESFTAVDIYISHLKSHVENNE